ncbi:MAG: hypothetical protein JWO94_4007 [Verrucomicrobiaceae bacterium]|nr:hypothetical protein [Verrucomicrobiaceae bacterium]
MSAIGWGLTFSFTLSSWQAVSAQLYLMGAGNVEYRPMFDYWLRMASAVFGCIGAASALACLRPPSFVTLIRLLGPFHLFLGTVLTHAAIRNHLTMALHPTFVPDITFCFLSGLLIQLPLTMRVNASKCCH